MPAATCSIFLLEISPNNISIWYYYVIFQTPYLLSTNANDYSSMCIFRKYPALRMYFLPHFTPYLPLHDGQIVHLTSSPVYLGDISTVSELFVCSCVSLSYLPHCLTGRSFNANSQNLGKKIQWLVFILKYRVCRISTAKYQYESSKKIKNNRIFIAKCNLKRQRNRRCHQQL